MTRRRAIMTTHGSFRELRSTQLERVRGGDEAAAGPAAVPARDQSLKVYVDVVYNQ